MDITGAPGLAKLRSYGLRKTGRPHGHIRHGHNRPVLRSPALRRGGTVRLFMTHVNKGLTRLCISRTSQYFPKQPVIPFGQCNGPTFPIKKIEQDRRKQASEGYVAPASGRIEFSKKSVISKFTEPTYIPEFGDLLRAFNVVNLSDT
ncbi:hypothetical protein [Stappia sp.]|uniref:hypothetical protein n=1 Tax=Stappia sp. TaxID=1870903 RepID=UPI003A9A1CBD